MSLYINHSRYSPCQQANSSDHIIPFFAGENVGTLQDGKQYPENSCVFGMVMVNDTLILGRKQTILYYKLS